MNIKDGEIREIVLFRDTKIVQIKVNIKIVREKVYCTYISVSLEKGVSDRQVKP